MTRSSWIRIPEATIQHDLGSNPSCRLQSSISKLKQGGLKEIVEVYASFARMPAKGEAELNISGQLPACRLHLHGRIRRAAHRV